MNSDETPLGEPQMCNLQPVRGKDELGDRMKKYEREWANGPPDKDGTLSSYDPICVRLDGRSFSAFTSGLARPQDPRLVSLMVSTALAVAEETNARVAYTQSDEISLVLLRESEEATAYFGGRPQKLCSVLASLASVHFNRELPKFLPEKIGRSPLFDCRVWNVPNEDEAANVIVWRELDAYKNGVSALARCHFSAKSLHSKGRADMIAMLAEKGVSLDSQPNHLLQGTYLRRVTTTRPYTTEERDKLPAKHAARTNPDLMVVRQDITMLDIPPLRLLANKPGVLFHGEDPVLKPLTEVVSGVTGE